MAGQNINITGSSNVVIGDNNQLTIQHSVQELVKIIDSSKGTEEEKAEAKGLLAQFLRHPLIATVAAAALQSFC